VRTLSQLAGNLAAATFELSEAQMASLDAASAPLPGFSARLTGPAIRRMIFGGNDVQAWQE
jgi:diketogulonate reductase-like aldo/keto reductase